MKEDIDFITRQLHELEEEEIRIRERVQPWAFGSFREMMETLCGRQQDRV